MTPMVREGQSALIGQTSHYRFRHIHRALEKIGALVRPTGTVVRPIQRVDAVLWSFETVQLLSE